jgi:DNA-binding NarL/FixJ family response regulator
MARTSKKSMRVLIADDNEGVRHGVAAIILSQENWEVCGEAKDGAEAIQKTRDLLPDVILLDISMPGVTGLEAARALRREAPGVKILIMSQNDPLVMLPGAKEAGAHACLDKSRLHIDLLPAIKSLKDPAEDLLNEGAGPA